MAAGIIDHETGTRDMRACRGWRGHADHGDAGDHRLGGDGGGAALNGFLSEEMFFGRPMSEQWQPARQCWPYIAVLAAAFSTAYSLRFIVTVFSAPATDLPATRMSRPC